MYRYTAVIIILLLFTGCLEGQRHNDVHKPYWFGDLYVEELILVSESYDDYLNRDMTIPETEKRASAEAVFFLVKGLFEPEVEPGDQDVWQEMRLHRMKGDCEDFAITCRAWLWAQHWKREDVVLLSSGGHTVAGVLIQGSVYILDNMESFLIPVAESAYTWVRICRNGRWYTIKQ